ncbi:MAG: serpin family protein, partial [Pyrinomonadaceae bacterium]
VSNAMSHPPRAAESARALARDLNEFALRLFKHLAAGATSPNVFISPFSVAGALLALHEGAAGATRRALAEALSLKSGGAADPGEAYAALLAAVVDDAAAGDELMVANSLWARAGLGLRAGFVAAARSHFRAEVAALDADAAAAARAVNGWVKEKTGGMIKEIVRPSALGAQALLVLLSAVHFKGVWKSRFDESKTRAGEFSAPGGAPRSLPMMRQSGRFKYSGDARVRAVELPYRGDRRSMLIFLPADETAFAEFLGDLNLRDWQRRLSALRETDGEVVMPRFKLSYETNLGDALAGLGAAPVFDPRADFSALCDGPAYVSEVRHKAAVEVTEEGTVAAAVTAVVMSRSLSAGFRLVVDRPFFCVIKDNASDAIIFAGAIKSP